MYPLSAPLPGRECTVLVGATVKSRRILIPSLNPIEAAKIPTPPEKRSPCGTHSRLMRLPLADQRVRASRKLENQQPRSLVGRSTPSLLRLHLWPGRVQGCSTRSKEGHVATSKANASKLGNQDAQRVGVPVESKETATVVPRREPHGAQEHVDKHVPRIEVASNPDLERIYLQRVLQCVALLRHSLEHDVKVFSALRSRMLKSVAILHHRGCHNCCVISKRTASMLQRKAVGAASQHHNVPVAFQLSRGVSQGVPAKGRTHNHGKHR